MKSRKTLGIQFVGRHSKADPKILQLFLCLTVDGRRSEFSMKKSIPKHSWNNAKGTVKGTSLESQRINDALEEIKSFVISKYHEMMVRDLPFTVEDLKSAVLGIEEEEFSLRELIDYHQEMMESTLKPGTLKNYETTKKYVLEYLEKSLRKKDISFRLVDPRFK